MSAMNPSVPRISVTPHSPAGINISAANKQYSILEDNLKQLHDIVEAVQHMKDVNILKIGEQCMRLSCSCPSLNEFSSDAEGVGSATSSPSHVDLSSSMSTPYISISSSSGIHLRQRDSGEWKSSSGRITSSLSSGEILRRRSWAALEDLSTTQGELDRKISKQRSASLSSLESDTEDIFLDTDNYNNLTLAAENALNSKTNSNNYNNRHATNNGGTTSNISTHSLNEADLLNDFNKIRLRREEEARLLQARLPLQKSVSTPSILAVAARDPSSSYSTSERPTETVDSNVPSDKCYIPIQKLSGTESETEEEMMVTLLEESRRRHFPFDQMVTKVRFDVEKPSAVSASVCGTFAYDDRPEKRRKRGSSLFFRKKKEKVKKSNGTHVWVNVPQGNLNNVVICDWCSKPVLEAKYAKYCGGCQSTVHQGLCVQHMMATECHQKGKSAKLSSKSMPAQNVTTKSNNKKNSNLGAMVTASQNNSSIISEEKEDTYLIRLQTTHEDHVINYSEEVPLVSQEFLNEEHIGAGDLDTDPFLGLQDEEPDTWSPTMNKDMLKKLKEKEIKRQEHIYEFILTEKHHCLTLILMQKIFVDGLKKHFQMDSNLPKMFPRLAELTDIHLKFLHNLRKRQKEAQVVETISDILLEQFSGNAALLLKAAYGEFCSRHRDAVEMYKCYLMKDPAFAVFVKHCQNNPLLKKKGIPECILFVTQRLTKYPLLIEPLIKTSKENKVELEKLTKALALVRDILTDVDSRVAEKEKEDRKLEIYYKTDAKSFTMYRRKKFKKSDILSNNRKLRFEGQAQLMQGRTKSHPVHVIVLSDILLFLVENNNKFSFFIPDGKAGVVCLQKLLVRELAGNDSRSIFLISSNPSDPEMFELKIQKPKEKTVWIDSIRAAVQNCPEDDQFLDEVTLEEKQKRVHISEAHMQQIVGSLRQKDVEQALIYEEKMSLLMKLLAAAGVDVGIEPPSYCHLVSQYLDNDTVRREVFNTIQRVNEIASSLYNINTNLSRSASSVGERQSNVYVSPLLPKRAETFGGFDNSVSCKSFVAGVGRKLSQQFQKRSTGDVSHETKSLSPSLPCSPVGTPELVARKLPTVNITVSSSQHLSQLPPQPQFLNCARMQYTSQELPILLQMEAEQQSTVVQLTSHIYTLASIIAQQMSSIDSLEAQLAFCRQELNQPSNEKERKPIYKHNQQLEELRNLQDKLSQEKKQWQREKEDQEKDLEEKRQQLQKLQDQVRKEQEDISLQREQLYRKLEAVSSHGLVNAANPPLLTSPQPGTQPTNSTSPSSLLLDLSLPATSFPVVSPTSPSETWKRRHESVRWKPSTTTAANALPLNLISATNQQKIASSVQVKQKLPLKLATKLGSTSSNGGSSSGGSNFSSSNSFSAGSLSPSQHSITGNKCQQPQQIIPRKLCETSSSSVASELRRSCSSSNSSTGGYERLVSSETTGSSVVATSPPTSHGNSGAKGQQVQQILPMKLRETNSSPKSILSVGTSELKRSCTTGNSGYEKLVSTETLNTAGSSPPSHSRTGSSPAMMQNIRMSPPASYSDDKERTNTYPKAPEKYRASIGSGEPALRNKKNEEEKVIFF